MMPGGPAGRVKEKEKKKLCLTTTGGFHLGEGITGRERIEKGIRIGSWNGGKGSFQGTYFPKRDPFPTAKKVGYPKEKYPSFESPKGV